MHDCARDWHARARGSWYSHYHFLKVVGVDKSTPLHIFPPLPPFFSPHFPFLPAFLFHLFYTKWKYNFVVVFLFVLENTIMEVCFDCDFQPRTQWNRTSVVFFVFVLNTTNVWFHCVIWWITQWNYIFVVLIFLSLNYLIFYFNCLINILLLSFHMACTKHTTCVSNVKAERQLVTALACRDTELAQWQQPHAEL